MPGGIIKLIFIACSVNYKIGTVYGDGITDLLLQANLQTLSDECKVRITPCVMSDKPKGTLTTKDYGNCLGKIPTSGLQTLNFTSPTTNDAAYDFWDNIRLNFGNYQIAAVYSNGDILPFKPMTGADVDAVSADATSENLGQTDFQGVITVLSRNIWKPIRAASLILDTGATLVSFLETQMNNDVNCGGSGTPVQAGDPFIAEIESVGGSDGNVISDTEANLIAGSPLTISMNVYKLANCVGNVTAQIGTIVRINPNTGATTNVTTSGPSSVIFNNAPSTGQVQSLLIAITAGVDAGEVYSIPITFTGAAGCTHQVLKQVIVNVT
jgi:hypothetical protein